MKGWDAGAACVVVVMCVTDIVRGCKEMRDDVSRC